MKFFDSKQGMKRSKRKQPAISQEEQSRRFIEAAQEAGVDADDATLKRIVRKIAKVPPKQSAKPKKKR